MKAVFVFISIRRRSRKLSSGGMCLAERRERAWHNIAQEMQGWVRKNTRITHRFEAGPNAFRMLEAKWRYFSTGSDLMSEII